MDIAGIAYALELLLLTTADGKTVLINPEEIVAVRPPRHTDAFVHGAKCLVFTTDGKHISAFNSCEEVAEKLKAFERK